MTTESNQSAAPISNQKLEKALRTVPFRGSQLSFEGEPVSALAMPYIALYAHEQDTAASIQIAFGGFHTLNPNHEVAVMWAGFGKPWTSVMAYGCLMLQASYATLFNNSVTPDSEDEQAMLNFLDAVLHKDYNVPVPFALALDDENTSVTWNTDNTAFAINFVVTVPCTEEDWQRTMKLRSLELEAAGKLQHYMIEQQLKAERKLAPGSNAIN